MAQSGRDELNVNRIFEKLLDLAAIGWAIETRERQALPVPTTYDEIHALAREWKAFK